MAGVTDGGLEAVRLRDRPEGAEAAVAAAHDDELFRIRDPPGDDGVHAGRVILEILAAPVGDVGYHEGDAVAGRAARIRHQQRIPSGGEDLCPRVKRIGKFPVGPAVNLEDQRIAPAALESERLHQEPLDVEIVRSLPADHFRFGDLEVLQLGLAKVTCRGAPAPLEAIAQISAGARFPLKV